jgi:hypothetical protein
MMRKSFAGKRKEVYEDDSEETRELGTRGPVLSTSNLLTKLYK